MDRILRNDFEKGVTKKFLKRAKDNPKGVSAKKGGGTCNIEEWQIGNIRYFPHCVHIIAPAKPSFQLASAKNKEFEYF